MFWKKKKVDFEIPDNNGDHREAFRIRPGGDRPILLKAGGTSAYLVNISGSGCCFRSGYFKVGVVVAGTLTITSDDLVFPVTVRVVTKQRDLCHCEFTKISSLAQEAIHAYVLDIQKLQIRNR
ncbi:MAG: PilZ domain-containing protein [Gammaproteobacteria bacterium]|nr:PilZ domain-containing protein [Gammaproteobacteria bacterium]MBT3724921.1 PilZ domain-containing protein [Gammaproteobacteria bacterium]MBT4078240.1 PilZ domain-containing protein [Gammaproteobacteria bacterium]MBT4862326.1 PilZ domain-containing protein [Gammaproteobacteria bacterium]MBT6552460.1 PilZ domain-containing protein [Gammaproteobacteria bacterium]